MIIPEVYIRLNEILGCNSPVDLLQLIETRVGLIRSINWEACTLCFFNIRKMSQILISAEKSDTAYWKIFPKLCLEEGILGTKSV